VRGLGWIVVFALAGCGQIARPRGAAPASDSGDSFADDAGVADSTAEAAVEESDAPAPDDVEGTLEEAGDDALPPACPILEAPLTCESAHYDCGLTGDGFGNVLQCGACPAPLTCALGHCVWPADSGPCVRATCDDYGATCGSVGDGCGGTLDCHGCGAPAYCGGGGLRRCGGTCAPEPVSRDVDCGVTVVCRPDP
jgi:hypothetical protein